MNEIECRYFWEEFDWEKTSLLSEKDSVVTKNPTDKIRFYGIDMLINVPK